MRHSRGKGSQVYSSLKFDEGFDVWRQSWFDLCRERGHELIEDEDFGGINQFVTDGGYCNGPGCKKCGWSSCMHCDADGSKIPVCKGVQP